MTAVPCDRPLGSKLLGQPNGERVRFEVESDESALRIQAVLGSLGFDVIRDHCNCGGDLYSEVARATSHRYRLTEREQSVLGEVLRGRSNEQIATHVQVSAATVKWHLHNIYFKLDVSSREDVLRRALRLDDLCWLRAPRLQRDALEQFNIAAHTVREQLRLSPGHDIEKSLRSLDDAIAQGQQLAGLATPEIPDCDH